MIKVGIVGFGFMGRMHYRCWNAIKGFKVTALCDANPQAFTSSAAAEGNIAGAADTIDFSSLKTFSKFDELLSSGATDVLSITLPTHMHPDFTIKALAAGRHVLCEKPMALTVEDCDKMIDAAKKSGKLLQIGQCIRFWPEYAVTREIVKSEKYGKVRAADFIRFSPLPSWNTSSWFTDEKRSGGMPLDLHLHDSDFIQHMFGMPDAVFSSTDPEVIHMSTSYLYKDGPAITADANWHIAPKYGFKMSFMIILEKATIAYDCTQKPTLKIYPNDGEPFTPELAPGDGYSQEIEYFGKKIMGKPVEELITLEQARNTISLVLTEKESAKKHAVVKVNKS